MIMQPWLRKLALVAHVTSSIGWFGAVAAFLALAVVGLVNSDTHTVRAVYVAADVVTMLVIVPLCFASLLTGLIQSLGTPWGLFRHYWVLAKLLITLLSTIILLIHRQPIATLADIAVGSTIWESSLSRVQMQLVVDAAAALFALLVATVLSIYKPKGVTPYGWRKQRQRRAIVPPVDGTV
jgi:hypothetical protein